MVNNTLSRFEAKEVIVGHCLVEKIEVRYSGKIVMMDVHYPDGKSSSLEFQALLIENSEMYRVDEKGKKTLLN